MAEAHGKLTGRPGIAFVTRGPGASNAAIGIHTAAQDSTPMIVFVGQVGERLRRSRGVPGDRLSPDVRQRGQVGRADRSRRAHSRIRRARLSSGDVGPAGAGRAGAARGHAGRARAVRGCARVEPVGAAPDALRDRGCARSCWRRRAGRWCSSAAAAGTPTPAPRCGDSPKPTSCPVACAFRNQDLFDNRHRNYAGDVGVGVSPRLAARIRDADVLLVIGERLGEMTTSGYTLLEAPHAYAAARARASRRRASWDASISPRSRSRRRRAPFSPR